MPEIVGSYPSQEELERRRQAATGMAGLPVETGPGLGRVATGMGVDVVGGGLSAAAGYALAPATFGLSIPVLAIGGGMASNYAAQKIEGEDFSIGRMIASGLLNLIPGAGKLAATTTGKIAARPLAEFARKEAIRGGGIAMGEKTVQTIIDEQRFPTFDEFVQSGAIGTAFGGALGTGIGVAAQKGLFNKLGGRTIDEVENSLSDPKEAKEVKDVIMGQEVDKTDVFKDVIGTRSQFFRDGLTERLDTRQVAMSNQVYNAINRDLSNSISSEDASLKLDRFINAASDKRNKDVDDRIMQGREKGVVYPDLASINSLGMARPFNDAKGRQAKAFKQRLLKDYNDLDSQWKDKNSEVIDSLIDKTIQTKDASRLADVAEKIDQNNVPGPLGKGIRKAFKIILPSEKLRNYVGGLGERFRRTVLPSKNIGDRIATELREIKELSNRSDRIATIAESAVNKALRKSRLTPQDRIEMEANIDRFLSGEAALGDLPESLRNAVGKELEMYREELERLQETLIGYLAGDLGESLDDELRKRVITVIKKSIENKNFVTRSYRFYADKTYNPSAELEAKAIEGETARIAKRIAGKRNVDLDDSIRNEAREQAKKEMAQRKRYSARAIQKDPSLAQKRAADKQEITFQAQGILEGRGDLSKELKEYLGEITDPGEKIFQTINKTSRLVNALQTDDALNTIFKAPSVQKALGINSTEATEEILTQTAYGRELMKDVRVPQEVNDALRDIFYSDAGYLMNNAVGRFVLDNLKSLNALSKISKTIYNPASYAPNFIGNFSSVIASGVFPFGVKGSRDIVRGMRFSLSEFDSLRNAVLGKGKKGKERLERMLTFEELGGGSANVLTSEIRKAGNRGVLGDLNQTIADPFSKFYNMGDTTMRYMAWEGTQRQLKKAIPELAQEGNKEALERAAMRIVRNTFQDYERVPAFIKKLSQIGIASPFVNFTAELMRNTYNQGRYIYMMLSDPKRLLGELGLDGIGIGEKGEAGLRRMGMKRLAGFSIVMGGAGTAVEIVGSKAKDLFGDKYKNLSDEEKLALNQTVAKSWHRGKRLLYIPNADGKTGKYMDTEYLVPQTLMTSAFVAGFKDEPLEVLPKLFKENFLGEGTFLLQASSNLFGKDQNGRDISVDPGLLNRYMDNANAFIQAAFEPGVVRELDKWNKTLRGTENALEVGSMVGRLFGLRWEEYDIERDAARRLAPDATAINNAKGLLGTSRKYDIKEQYDRNYVKLNQDREGILKKITGHYNNLKVLGLDGEQALNVLDKTALSTNDKFESITGYYSPMPYEEPLTKTEIYESLGDTPEQRIRAIRAMRGQGVDPREIKKLMDTHKRMVRKARRGQPAMPASLMLLKKMNPEDRLRRLIDPSGPYRLTRSNRPLIRELQRLDILERSMLPYLPPGR
jgi:hypothetical protein